MTTVPPEIVQGYVVGMIGDITRLHAEYYHPNWGLGLELEARVAQDVAAFLLRYDERLDGIWTVSQQQRVEAAIIIDGSGREPGEARLRYFIIGDRLRGQGVGRRLVQAAMDFCDERQFKRVTLKTFTGLDAAQHLYKSFGFVFTHEATENGLTEQFYERVRGV